MFGIVLSALNSVLGFVFRSVVIKFGVMFGIYFLVAAFVPVAKQFGLIPDAAGLNGAFSALPSGVSYYLHVFAMDVGVPILFSAWASRFVLRRIPFLN